VFRVKHVRIDTLAEHLIFIHEATVRAGNLGFRPLDRVRVVGRGREIIGILNFCADTLARSTPIARPSSTAPAPTPRRTPGSSAPGREIRRRPRKET
jgi:hypothetical protein